MKEEFKNMVDSDSLWYSKFKTGIRTPLGYPQYYPKKTKPWICSFLRPPAWFIIITIIVNFLPKSNLRPFLGAHTRYKPFWTSEVLTYAHNSSGPNDEWKESPCRLTIRNSAIRLFHYVLFNMISLHLVLPALNLSSLNAGILIMMQQVRLMLFSVNMVDYSMSFLSLSIWDFVWGQGLTISSFQVRKSYVVVVGQPITTISGSSLEVLSTYPGVNQDARENPELDKNSISLKETWADTKTM